MAKRTRRSTDYLARYGYPSARELRREAGALAGASVPTVRSISRPYNRQQATAKAFLEAVRAALAESSSGVGAGYDKALAQEQAVSDAAQARLAGLGLGESAAGAQAVTGARGDSAQANLIASSAAAKNYQGQLPGIAAGATRVQSETLSKGLLDALQNRRDALSQSFVQALNTVQGQAMQRAQFNMSADQFAQQIAAQQAAAAAQAGAAKAAYLQSENHWRADFIAKNGYDPYTGAGQPGKKLPGAALARTAKALGLTTNEYLAKRSQGFSVLATGDPSGKTKMIPVYTWKGTDGQFHTSNVSPDKKNVSGGIQITYDNNGQSALANGVPFEGAVERVIEATGFSRALAQSLAAYQSYLDYIGNITGPRGVLGPMRGPAGWDPYALKPGQSRSNTNGNYSGPGSGVTDWLRSQVSWNWGQ